MYCAQKKKQFMQTCNFEVACMFFEKVSDISEEIRISGNDSQSNDFTWSLYKQVLVSCKFSLSLKVQRLFCQSRQMWATLVQHCFECNPSYSSAAIMSLDFGNQCIHKTSVSIAEKNQKPPKDYLLHLTWAFLIDNQSYFGTFEGMKSTHIIIGKNSHIYFIWCIHTERHL